MAGPACSRVDYVVQVASTHQVVIFGEAHDVRSQVSFLIEAIPDLYRRAGVRCIAMEVCTREDNDDIARLVTAPAHNNELALRIARHQPWHTWGGKEYWDVLYAVWQLNRSLQASDKKMRVVGIDSQWDGPSFALGSGGGDDAVQAPLWERLRLLRVIPDIPEFVLRDELMAREVEHQIIDTGERGIVWCGAHHSFVTYRQFHGKGPTGSSLRRCLQQTSHSTKAGSIGRLPMLRRSIPFFEMTVGNDGGMSLIASPLFHRSTTRLVEERGKESSLGGEGLRTRLPHAPAGYAGGGSLMGLPSRQHKASRAVSTAYNTALLQPGDAPSFAHQGEFHW